MMNHILNAFLLIVMVSFPLIGAANSAGDISSYPYAESRPVPNQYIIVFEDKTPNPKAEAANIVRANKGELLHSYQYAIKGFSAK